MVPDQLSRTRRRFNRWREPRWTLYGRIPAMELQEGRWRLDVFDEWLRVTNEWRPSRFQPQTERLDRVRPSMCRLGPRA